jgi:DNA invertase Pin-like site-specific DNA recombinase
MNTIIYARFSPQRDADKSMSIEAQVDACRKFAEANKMTVTGMFEDREMSGADPNRPGLWAAVEAVPKGGVLLAYRLDRVARDVYLSIMVEREVEKRGGRVVSTQGEGTASDSPHEQLVRDILRALASYERRVTSVRTKMLMRYRQNVQHQSMGKSPPYGWLRVEAGVVDGRMTYKIVENPYEQTVIREVWIMRGAGMGSGEIARRLTEAGFNPRGRVWHANTVRRIVKQKADSDSQAGLVPVH